MKLMLFPLIVLLNITNVSSNEMYTVGWSFPTPDQIQVSQNRVKLFCEASPSKCPVGFQKNGSSESTSDASLFGPKTTSTANSISVVLAGDDSSVILNTSQDAEDNEISSKSDNKPTIDYKEVINYKNN